MDRLCLLIMVLVVVHASASAARAAGVVGTGTSESCNEAALDKALAGGGSISFDCGGAATIAVSTTKAIESDTEMTGGGLITISGGNAVQVFRVGFGVRLSIDGLSIVAGYSGLDPGGGIRNVGTLTLRDCTVSGNTSLSFGGGLDNEGTCVVENSTFMDNEGGSGGGGIANFRSLTVAGSTIFHNTGGIVHVVYDNHPGSGGGIMNLGDLTVGNTTFSNNTVISNTNPAVITPAIGGGLYNAAMARVANCTFSRNRAPDIGYCSGIANMGLLTVSNTLITNSLDNDCCNDVYGIVSNESTHNLVDDEYSYCGSSFTQVTAAALQLRGLADNGGPTLTVALLPGSVAIGAGDTTACMESPVGGVDQRGAPRFGPGDPRCDVGAFEASLAPNPVATPTPAATLLTLDSDPGDSVGHGTHQTLTLADGTFLADHSFGYVTVSFIGNALGTWWTLSFAAPSGFELLPGYYSGAATVASGVQPGLNVGGNGFGCGYLSGRFSISEAQYAIDGSVDSFAADFEQHCEDYKPALFGTIRLNSNVPSASLRLGTPTVRPTPTRPPATPTRTPSPVPPLCYGDCDGDGRITVVELLIGINAALGNTSLTACPSFDINRDQRVTVDEILTAVNAALGGCRPL